MNKQAPRHTTIENMNLRVFWFVVFNSTLHQVLWCAIDTFLMRYWPVKVESSVNEFDRCLNLEALAVLVFIRSVKRKVHCSN